MWTHSYMTWSSSILWRKFFIMSIFATKARLTYLSLLAARLFVRFEHANEWWAAEILFYAVASQHQYRHICYGELGIYFRTSFALLASQLPERCMMSFSRIATLLWTRNSPILLGFYSSDGNDCSKQTKALSALIGCRLLLRSTPTTQLRRIFYLLKGKGHT